MGTSRKAEQFGHPSRNDPCFRFNAQRDATQYKCRPVPFWPGVFYTVCAVAYALVDSCPLASSSLAARVHIPHRLFMSTSSRCRRVHVCSLFKSPTAGEQMREHSQTRRANASLSRLLCLLRRVGAVVHDATVRLRQFESLSERATCFQDRPTSAVEWSLCSLSPANFLPTACVANPVLEVSAAEQLQYLSSG